MPVMGSSKVPSEEYVKRSARERVGLWRWWFILLLLAGLIAVVLVFTKELSPDVETTTDMAVGSPLLLVSFIAPAAITPSPQTATNAGQQKPGEPPEKKSTSADMKPYVMIGILSLLGFITMVSLGVSLFSKNEKSVALASDLLKTCVGFFIGVAASYFGA